MAIDLYFTTLSPPCRAVLMAIKQLGIEVNIKFVDLRKGEHLTPEYLKMNPAHCVPTIVDKGFVMWESRAILQYLFNTYAPNSSLYPKDPQKRAIIDRTLNFDQTMNSSIVNAIIIKVLRGVEPTEQQIQSLENNLKLMDTLIGDNKYVTGSELTIADISVLASITALLFNDYKDLKGLSNLKTWFERIQKELPYYDEVNGPMKELIKQLTSGKK